MSESSISTCEECGSKIERVITGGTGLIFKGSGFYLTDYKDGKKKSDHDVKKNQNSTEKSEKKNSTENTKAESQSKSKNREDR